MVIRRAVAVAALIIGPFGLTHAGDQLPAEDNPDLNSLLRRIEDLEQQVRIQQRKAELEAESKTAAAQATPVLSAGEKGFSLQSAQGDFKLRLGGYVQADSRFYIGDSGSGDRDTFLIRRARPVFEGTVFKDFDFRIMPDFAGPSTTLQDAYLDWRIHPGFQLRAGKFKEPVSLERLQSATALSFAERGYPSLLAPNRDVGLQLHGSVAKDRVNYAVGVFNGASDGGSSVMDTDDEKDVAARVFVSPFAAAEDSVLRGLSLGVAGTYGNSEGPPSGYRSVGQQVFFEWNDDVVHDGTVLRLSPQLSFYSGPFGFLGEYIISSQEVRLGNTADTLQHSAWQVLATYVLTGEDASYRGVKPRKRFSLADGGWGAVEVAVRYSGIDIDNDAFPIYADAAAQASRADSFGFGVNWYLNPNVKISTDYTFTDFEGGEDGRNRHVLITRFQVAF